MENFDMENKFKEGFDNINPMLDNDEIWNNIEPYLKKKKKKRRFIIWFFFGAIGILGLFLFNTIGPKTSTKLSDVENQNEASKAAPLASNERDMSNTISDSQSSSINNIEVDQHNEVSPEDSKIETNLSSSKQVPTQHSTRSRIGNTPSSTESYSGPIHTTTPLLTPSSDSNTTTKKAVQMEEPNKDKILAEEITVNTQEQPKTTKKSELLVENSTVATNSPPPAISLDKSTETPPQKSESNSTKALEPEKDRIQNDNAPSIDEVKNDPPIKKRLTKKERKEANKKRKEERKKAKAEKEKKKKEKKAEKPKSIKPVNLPDWKFHLQLMGSGIYTFHNLKDQGRNESSYLDYRDQYVSGIEGFGTSINFVAESPTGFMLTSGIEYQQLHEQIKRVEEISESELEEVIETITEDSEGNIINQTSSMQLVTTTTQYNQKFYNQYRFINIPLGVGYTFKRNKMRFKLLGGIDINTYFRFSGRVINKSEEYIKLHSGSVNGYNKFFNKTIGIGIWTNLEWHQPIGEKTSLVVSPGIQAPIGSLTPNNDKWPISHRLVKLKLEVGLNYMIGDLKKQKVRGKRKKRE